MLGTYEFVGEFRSVANLAIAERKVGSPCVPGDRVVPLTMSIIGCRVGYLIEIGGCLGKFYSQHIQLVANWAGENVIGPKSARAELARGANY